MKFAKIVTGYVIQHFEGGRCTSQNFVADNTPTYEDYDESSLLGCPIHPEVYYPFDMNQPDADDAGLFDSCE